ncbi:MAG: glycosyltransferase family 4 protein [Trichlorobacter sp.]
MKQQRLRILLLVRENLSLTGSGTYEANLLRELGNRFDVTCYRSPSDLEQEYDVAHCTNLKHLDPVVARQLRCPLVVDLHDYYWVRFYPFFCPDAPVRLLLQLIRSFRYRRWFSMIDGVILHGRFLFDLIPHPRRYFSFYFGLDYSAITPRPWQERENLILFVGGDYFRKGLPRILKALPGILAKVPDARLLVIGREPWHSRLLARWLARRLPVDFIYGIPREEVYRTYSRGKVLVLPSEIECTPLVIAEGTYAGLPPVVSRVGGHPELVQDGVTGFLFEREDTAALAEAVITCLTDQQRSAELVAAGQAFFDRCTIDGMIDSLSGIYQDLVDNPPERLQR